MCGIVGIFNARDAGPVDRSVLNRMNDAHLHRGPDGGGLHMGNGIGLGHRRLSIIDLESGSQPMSNASGSISIVFNGEIYNFHDVRHELQQLGYEFQTASDTEAIIHGWDAWGIQCLDRLRGMFAFALWHAPTETLFLCRDRLGKKPLYYTMLESQNLIFGSELKSLLQHPEIRPMLDPTAIEDYFSYGYIPDPKSIYRDIYKLPPAHIMTCRRGEAPKLDAYWDIEFDRHVPDSIEEAGEQLIELLGDATRMRLISDVPLGAFLSGGVDSSGIVALMAKSSSDPVNTFSISFDHDSVDESEYAQEMADRYRTNHLSRKLDPEEFSILDDIARIYDEPFGDSSAMPTFRVCAEARKRVTVALSGDGGDELFAGYRRYLWHHREARVRNALTPELSGLIFGTLGRLYPKMDWAPQFLRAKSTFQELGLGETEAFFQSVSANNMPVRNELFSPGLKSDLDGYYPIDTLVYHMERAKTDTPLLRAQYADIKTWLAGGILTKVDRASMANSLEVRAPLLDHKIAEWAVNLPARFKLNGGTGKYILKQALEPYVSKRILYRPKQGFTMPLEQWFRGPLKQRIRESVCSERMQSSALFEPAQLQKYVDEHQSGIRNHSAILWQLMIFDAFLKNNGA